MPYCSSMDLCYARDECFIESCIPDAMAKCCYYEMDLMCERKYEENCEEEC